MNMETITIITKRIRSARALLALLRQRTVPPILLLLLYAGYVYGCNVAPLGDGYVIISRIPDGKLYCPPLTSIDFEHAEIFSKKYKDSADIDIISSFIQRMHPIDTVCPVTDIQAKLYLFASESDSIPEIINITKSCAYYKHRCFFLDMPFKSLLDSIGHHGVQQKSLFNELYVKNSDAERKDFVNMIQEAINRCDVCDDSLLFMLRVRIGQECMADSIIVGRNMYGSDILPESLLKYLDAESKKFCWRYNDDQWLWLPIRWKKPEDLDSSGSGGRFY